jgi:DNA processing protein
LYFVLLKMTEDLNYKIAVTLLPHIGDLSVKKLIAYCGGAKEVFFTKKKDLDKIPGISIHQLEVLTNAKKKEDALNRAEEEIGFMKENDIQALFFLDENYPKRLKHCDDSPIMLYYSGNSDLNCEKVISVVGTRNATDYGKETCARIISEIASHKPLIASGLAYGIDIAAHKSAIVEGLPTVGVVAHGLDRIYPSIHTSTAEKMKLNGGILTDFISQTNPDRENFPKRNRIIAGMADAVLVVEAGIKGGALITADIANSYNRDVFAVPGKIGDVYSIGCNKLIKSNKAALIESGKDIEYILGWEQKKKKNVQKQLFIELSDDEAKLVDILKEKGSLPIDDLCLIAQFNTSKTSALLLNLEFSGIIKSLPGKIFQLN